MSVYFYAPVFSVDAVEAVDAVVDEEGEVVTPEVLAELPRIMLGKGNPVEQADPVPGTTLHYDSSQGRFVVKAPDGTFAQSQWVSKTFEQITTAYPGVF